jgi:hypothetical protein
MSVKYTLCTRGALVNVCYLPDGRHCVFGKHDNDWLSLDIDHMKFDTDRLMFAGDFVYVSLSPDGRQYAYVLDDLHTITVKEIMGGFKSSTLTTNEMLTGFTWSNNSKFLKVCSFLFHANTGRVGYKLSEHKLS